MKLIELNEILKSLNFPERFNTEQTGVCVLVLLKKQEGMKGFRIHDIITNAKILLNKNYAENTRESIRKLSLKRLVNHGLVVLNPDNPKRPINSGMTNYSLEPSFKEILSASDVKRQELINEWGRKHKEIIVKNKDFISKHEIYVDINQKSINLSSGNHNVLIKHIVEIMIKEHYKSYKIFYIGDTRKKEAFLDKKILGKLNLKLDVHDKLPDVMAYSNKLKSILVVESVTSVGAFEDSRVQEINLLLNKINN